MMETIVRGAVSGFVATVPMTAVIGLGDAAGLLRTPPPVQITENVAERAGEEPDPESPAFTAAWLAAHFGYGAACGAIYAAARPHLPRSDLAAGLVFGGAVWAVSYLGLLPALELFPRATEDSPSRQAVMIAAHAVYGVSLASIEDALASQNPHAART
jgi:putative membrane protein